MTVPDFASEEEAQKWQDTVTGQLAYVILATLSHNVQRLGLTLEDELAKHLAGRALHAALARMLAYEGQAYVSEN